MVALVVLCGSLLLLAVWEPAQNLRGIRVALFGFPQSQEAMFKGYMGFRQTLFVWLCSGLWCTLRARGVGSGAAPIIAVAAHGRFASPILIAGNILALVFFVLWLSAKKRERGLLVVRQEMQSELLARSEELNRERADLADARYALRVQAIRDEVTGLPNRSSVCAVLEREVARAVRDKSTLSIVLVDIDHLGKINQTNGQAAGDEVLKEVGQRLEYVIRSYDAAGRYSGGDFLLVLPGFEADTELERLCAIHDAICAKPVVFPTGWLSVTCSFGVSVLLPHDFYSSEELLVRASQAMSTAKLDGRNRIGFFAASTDSDQDAEA